MVIDQITHSKISNCYVVIVMQRQTIGETKKDRINSIFFCGAQCGIRTRPVEILSFLSPTAGLTAHFGPPCDIRNHLLRLMRSLLDHLATGGFLTNSNLYLLSQLLTNLSHFLNLCNLFLCQLAFLLISSFNLFLIIL